MADGGVKAGRRALASAMMLFVAGCGAGSDAADGVVADVPPPDLWTFSADPDFSVSESSGPVPYQLFRVFYGVILRDGSVVVANRGSSNLVNFDPSGRATRTVGGPGQGPGEFTSIGGIFSTGDGIGVFDRSSFRISSFSKQGERQGEFDFGGSFEVPFGYIEGTGIVTRPYTSMAVPAVPGDERTYRIWNDAGELVDESLGVLEPDEVDLRFDYANQRGGTVLAGVQLNAGCVSRMVETVVGDEIFVVQPDSAVVIAIAASGQSREVYRAPERQPITDETRDRMRSMFAILRTQPPDDAVEAMFREMGDIGDPLPAWQGVLPDPSGRLWLETSNCLDPSVPVSYEVIDLTGERLGTVLIPAEMTVLAVRGDRVLVVRRDDLGVEYVELYRITD